MPSRPSRCTQLLHTRIKYLLSSSSPSAKRLHHQCLQAPLPRTSGSSPTHATSPRTQDSDLHCHASNSGSTGESQTRRGSLGHDPASSPRQCLHACSNPASHESILGLPSEPKTLHDSTYPPRSTPSHPAFSLPGFPP